jgi:hypothetical protein
MVHQLVPRQQSALESRARQCAYDFIDVILQEAQSAADVPAITQRILRAMHQEWLHIDWNQHTTEYDVPMLPLGFEGELTRADQNQLKLVREFLDTLLLSDSEATRDGLPPTG